MADGWEAFPEAVPAARGAWPRIRTAGRWGTRLFILEDPRTLVGWGGFKGPPADGVVEVGYAVAPDFRGRGIAGRRGAGRCSGTRSAVAGSRP